MGIMNSRLEFESLNSFVSPFKEMSAYEALWTEQKSSFKTISELFQKHPEALPSELVTIQKINEISTLLLNKMKESSGMKFNVMLNKTYDYPEKLRDARYPVEVLYYSGDLGLLYGKGVSIVGSRKPTEEGLKRARKLVKLLVQDNFTIFSGLAEGIDTMAHMTAIENGGSTVAVIGTPLNEVYPKQNNLLQRFIASNHLLISQVPFLRYSMQNYKVNRFFFPERNKTMSALSDATVIIEASETSGTLIQARAAIEQGRKLFILQNCFENKNITWPKKYEDLGAIRVREYDDIIKHLKP